ncbi:hypothetical protein NC651_028796 [Populus alba x Populus x berolinensis]|nr:hypothetical protein NC651_028796 [Populus alba x Populus x berolinensis]
MKMMMINMNLKSSRVSRSTSREYDKYRQNFQSKPSRFKLEAMNKSSAKRVERANWDFKQSLWDSFEIVNVYKRLERGLVLDDSFSGADAQRRVHRKKGESKKSLTNLFNLISSRRFKEAEDPRFPSRMLVGAVFIKKKKTNLMKTCFAGSFPTCLVGKPSKFLSCAFSEKYFHRNLLLQVPALS